LSIYLNKFRQALEEIIMPAENSASPHNIFACGLSGGEDSLALAMLLNEYLQQYQPANTLNNTNVIADVNIDVDTGAIKHQKPSHINNKLICLTIDHKIRQESSHQAREIQQWAKKNKIEHHILENHTAIPKSNLEAYARQIRYQLLLKFCHQHSVEYLVMGHHMQDVAENFLIRANRASGLYGLSSIDKIIDREGKKIIRPLLNFTKTDILNIIAEYQQKYQPKIIYDESNDDVNFTRNKIRKGIFNKNKPLLEYKNIASSAKILSEYRDFFEEEFKKQSGKIVSFKYGTIFICYENFCHASKLMQKQILHRAIFLLSTGIIPVRASKIANLQDGICHLGHNLKARTISGLVVFYAKHPKPQIIITREHSKIEDSPHYLANYQKHSQITWDGRFTIFNIKPLQQLEGISINKLNYQAVKKITSDKNGFASHKNYEEFLNTPKRVLITQPVIKKQGEIIAVPSVGYVKSCLSQPEVLMQIKCVCAKRML